MPYKNAEDRAAQRKRWAAANPDKVKKKDENYRKANANKINEYHNERNFRFRQWEARRTQSLIKDSLQDAFVGTVGQMENPEFIFIYNGQRQYTETLNDPLPRF